MKKTWFITGTSRGIGLEIAQAALASGDNVVATARNITSLREQFSEDQKTQLECLELDVNNPVQANIAVNRAVERFGNIDILVNNAGFGQLGHFETVELSAIEQQFSTNVFGLMQVTRAVLVVMRKQQCGHILNMSSIGGALGFDGAAVYCAAKFAVEGFSESLALEVARFGINVTIVEPGFFRTDFLDPTSVRYGNIKLHDYEKIATAQKMQFDDYSHVQPGDPKRLAQLIVDTAGKGAAPLRLIAGTDSLAMSRETLNNRIKELELWAKVSVTTDHRET
ncbi:SDR family NAD(P)-dependent oxidoreductase [uncultured Paraglaciecola sp.]|uniref:SDR family NAD(P)-dependent oxidoreductase n=1 Tax=uncultured Paraglaciecola sp. TaxID=1765024 RepID=UPI0030D7A3AC|tara:strand:- start:3794 stop:4636 length:843 start_codon:yes stop_codon:yes gene_type:complete